MIGVGIHNDSWSPETIESGNRSTRRCLSVIVKVMEMRSTTETHTPYTLSMWVERVLCSNSRGPRHIVKTWPCLWIRTSMEASNVFFFLSSKARSGCTFQLLHLSCTPTKECVRTEMWRMSRFQSLFQSRLGKVHRIHSKQRRET